MWYYSKNGSTQEGPVSKKEVKKIFETHPDLLVWCKGLPRWKKAKNVFGTSILIKFSIVLGITGVLGTTGYFGLKLYKPGSLPEELIAYQKPFDAISKVPSSKKVLVDLIAEKSKGIIIFSNLKSDTQFELRIYKRNKLRSTHKLTLHNHYAWKTDLKFPKGLFEIRLLSQDLPDFKNSQGISIIRGMPKYSGTFRFQLYEDPSWKVYIQHVKTWKVIVNDFRLGYNKISRSKKKKQKIIAWKKWAPGWSEMFDQWGKSSTTEAGRADDKSLYLPLLKLYEMQAIAWDMFRKVILKSKKNHKKLLASMKKVEVQTRKVKTKQ